MTISARAENIAIGYFITIKSNGLVGGSGRSVCPHRWFVYARASKKVAFLDIKKLNETLLHLPYLEILATALIISIYYDTLGLML